MPTTHSLWLLKVSACTYMYIQLGLYLGFGPTKGDGIAIYTFHGGRPLNCTSEVYHNLGGAPSGKCFDFEHPEITFWRIF